MKLAVFMCFALVASSGAFAQEINRELVQPIISSIGLELAQSIRNEKPSKLIERTFQIEDASLIDNVPEIQVGQNAVASGVDTLTQFLHDNPDLVIKAMMFTQEHPEMLQKATEATGELRQLFVGLLAAMKQRDDKPLELIRNTWDLVEGNLPPVAKDAVSSGVVAGRRFLEANPALVARAIEYAQSKPEIIERVMESAGRFRELFVGLISALQTGEIGPHNALETADGVLTANVPGVQYGKDAVAAGVHAGSKFLAENPDIVDKAIKYAQERPEVLEEAVAAAGELQGVLLGILKSVPVEN